MGQARDLGGFMGNGLVDELGIAAQPGLHQPVLAILADLHRAIERDAVEPLRVHILQEIGHRDRRAVFLERDAHIAARGVQHHIHHCVDRRRRRRLGRRWRGSLWRRRRRFLREQAGGRKQQRREQHSAGQAGGQCEPGVHRHSLKSFG
jgi:hypothetical protein